MVRDKERKDGVSLVCATTTQTRGKASSPTLSSLSQLTYTPQIQVQGLLSLVLQQVRDGATFFLF